jgi:hypothetical protein
MGCLNVASAGGLDNDWRLRAVEYRVTDTTLTSKEPKNLARLHSRLRK